MDSSNACDDGCPNQVPFPLHLPDTFPTCTASQVTCQSMTFTYHTLLLRSMVDKEISFHRPVDWLVVATWLFNIEKEPIEDCNWLVMSAPQPAAKGNPVAGIPHFPPGTFNYFLDFITLFDISALSVISVHTGRSHLTILMEKWT